MPPRSRNLQAVLDLIRANATDGRCGAPMEELGAQLGVSARTMRRYAICLEALGYLRIQRLPGRPSAYELTAKGQEQGGGMLARISQRLRSFPLFLPLVRTDTRLSSTAAGQTPETVTVGREDVFAALQASVAKRRPTLLVGPPGIGKSRILAQFAADLGQVSGDLQSSSRGSTAFYLNRTSPIKLALLNLAQLIHGDSALEVAGLEAGYMDWEDVARKLSRLRISELVEVVTRSMRDHGYVLVLDHLEAITPAMLSQVDALMEVALVIGAADELKDSIRRLWWSFERIEIPPLSKEQGRELLWQVADRNKIENLQLFETRVLQQAGGNPLAIITMAAKTRTAELSAQEIRGLQHGAGTRYVPLTPVLLLVGALIIAARFVALGLDDRDLYILAGFGYAFFFLLRQFIYRVD